MNLNMKLQEDNKTLKMNFGEVHEISGEDGFSPIAKVEQVEDGAKITITDKNGTTTTTITNGKDGKDGYTPIKGIDYWTEEDKTEIKSSLSGGGGETWKLVASYTHSGNRVIQPTALDMATGYFTCENHGLVTGDSIITFYNIKNQSKCPIPYELLGKANYNDKRIYPIPHKVTVIDDDTFMITSKESYAETNNKNIDVTKFHFETQNTDFTGFNNLNIDLNTYDVKIIAHDFGKRVNFKFSTVFTDNYHWLAMDAGHEYGLLQGVPITPLGGVESYGSVILSLQNGILYGKSEQYMHPIILTSGALDFSRPPIGHHYNCPVFSDNSKIDVITNLYFNMYFNNEIKPKNGGWIQVWKRKK